MRPENLEMWSKTDLISEIYNLQHKLQIYEADNKDDPIADIRRILGIPRRPASLLLSLMDGRIHTKENILQIIYMDRPDEAPESKIVDVFVCKIRKKVKPWGVRIETIWGSGYRLVDVDRLKDYLAGKPLEFVPVQEPVPVIGIDHSKHVDTGANLKAVFTVIREIAGKTTRATFTSRTLTSKSGIKVKVQPYITKLHKQGYIRIVKRPDPYDPFSQWKVDVLQAEIGVVRNQRQKVRA